MLLISDLERQIEFATLLFFASLFVLMRALEELGLIAFIGRMTADIIRSAPEGGIASPLRHNLVSYIFA